MHSLASLAVGVVTLIASWFGHAHQQPPASPAAPVVVANDMVATSSGKTVTPTQKESQTSVVAKENADEEKCAQKEIALMQQVAAQESQFGPYISLYDPGSSDRTHYNLADGVCYDLSTQDISSAVGIYLSNVDADKVLADYSEIYDNAGDVSVICRTNGVDGCTKDQFNQLVQQKMESAPTWSAYSPQSGAFKVTLPTLPISIPINSGQVSKGTLYFSQTVPLTSYYLADATLANVPQNLTTNQIINIILGGVFAIVDPSGQYTKMTPLTQNGVQGMVFDVTGYPDRLSGELFYLQSSNHVYMLYRTCRESVCSDADWQRVLSSFTILKN